MIANSRHVANGDTAVYYSENHFARLAHDDTWIVTGVLIPTCLHSAKSFGRRLTCTHSPDSFGGHGVPSRLSAVMAWRIRSCAVMTAAPTLALPHLALLPRAAACARTVRAL